MGTRCLPVVCGTNLYELSSQCTYVLSFILYICAWLFLSVQNAVSFCPVREDNVADS